MKKLKTVAVILAMAYLVCLQILALKVYQNIFQSISGPAANSSDILNLTEVLLWGILELLTLVSGIGFLAETNEKKKDKMYRIFRFVYLMPAFFLLLHFFYNILFNSFYFADNSFWEYFKFIILQIVRLFVIIALLICKPDKQVEKIDISNYELVAYTSAWHRFVHYLVDILFLLPVILLWREVLYNISSNHLYEFWYRLGSIVILLLYWFLSEAVFGQTLGKMITKSCVVSHGAPLSTGRILLRTLCRLIPFAGFSFLFRANWHYKVSSTAVVYIDTWQKVFEEDQPKLNEPETHPAG